VTLLDGMQSALNPHSPGAQAVAQLAWVLFAGGAIAFVAVMVLAALALRTQPRWLATPRAVVIGGVAVPIVVLTALILLAARAAPAHDDAPSRVVRVVGQQWWWRVQYLRDDGSVDFETANEIRLPAGERVAFRLETADVLHSFWLPALGGKVDMVPGRVTRLVATPDVEGVVRGQCAEYCGGPHAQMALYAVIAPRADFERWQAAQRAPARVSNALFEARCATCHAVRGTPAAGARGPDLTHVASRRSIGAGTLVDPDAAAFARFVASSQHVKPGNLMPSFHDLAGDELAELGRYLASLE
jgi:cytochrome c oxidase subunit 2